MAGFCDKHVDQAPRPASGRVGTPVEALTEAFAVFDMDGNGDANSAMLKHVLTTQGDCLADDEIEELMQEADPRGECLARRILRATSLSPPPNPFLRLYRHRAVQLRVLCAQDSRTRDWRGHQQSTQQGRVQCGRLWGWWWRKSTRGGRVWGEEGRYAGKIYAEAECSDG